MSVEPAFQIKKKQLLYAGIVGVIGLACIGVLIFSLEQEVMPSAAPAPQETTLITAGKRINPQEVWVERMESEHKLTQEKIAVLEKLLTATIKGSADREESLHSRIEAVEQRKQEESFPGVSKEALPSAANVQGTSSTASTPSSSIGKVVFNLSGQLLPSQQNLPKGKTGEQESAALETTLPAGTFVKAILLGGVDASTAISSPSDPRPVLLRIADHGTLPRKFKSDLKDCHLLASCYGDLSSERVYMRLEKLTCTERLTGEISETQVAGYVVGEDGRAGVRGVVADKAGPLIRNSLVGGFLSGMGQFFGAQQHAGLMLSPFGQMANPMSTLSPQQLLSAGASSGTSHALEKMSDFFIRRAEQLQPVLQVAAGREVDVVFTQGTRFGETQARQSLRKIRNESRKHALQKFETQTHTPSWLPQEQAVQEEAVQENAFPNPPTIPGDEP